MTKKEKELFKSLCSFKENTFDKKLLSAATPNVLGHLFFNRMQATAYGTLKKHGLAGAVNRHMSKTLKKTAIFSPACGIWGKYYPIAAINTQC